MVAPDREFRNDIVRFADHTVNTIALEGYELSHCRVVGPAVVLPVGNTSITHCSWDDDIDNLFWEISPGRERPVGAIFLVDCIFSGCTFEATGIAGPAELRAKLEQGFR